MTSTPPDKRPMRVETAEQAAELSGYLAFLNKRGPAVCQVERRYLKAWANGYALGSVSEFRRFSANSALFNVEQPSREGCPWSPIEDEVLTALWGDLPGELVAKLLARSKASVRIQASRLDVTKGART